MSKELARALTDMAELIKDWNNGMIATEGDFLFKLKLINARITLLLPEAKAGPQQLRI